jgi:hypothetical protein
MTAGLVAVVAGAKLVDRVDDLAVSLGLDVHREFRLGRRVWGAERRIDLLLTQPATRVRLGVECKVQNSGGSAEEKLLATVQDIETWPMRGLVVLDGNGFSVAMRNHVVGSGRAVDFDDLEVWLRIFFRLELPERP